MESKMITEVFFSPATCNDNPNLLGIGYLVLHGSILVGNVLVFKNAEDYIFQYPKVDYGNSEKIDRFSFTPISYEARKLIEESIIGSYKKSLENDKEVQTIQ